MNKNGYLFDLIFEMNLYSEGQFSRRYCTAAILNASIGFLFTNLCIGVYNSLQTFFQKELFSDSSEGTVTFIITAPFLAGGFGAIMAVPITARIGRRKILMAADLIAVVGIILTLVYSLSVMIIGRLLVGLSIGVMSVVIPLYIVEVSPPEFKNLAFSLSSLVRAIGMLIAFLEGFGMRNELLTEKSNQTWRILIGVTMAAPVLNFIGFLYFKYETPRHLVSQQNFAGALDSLNRMYTSDAKRILDDLRDETDHVELYETISYREIFDTRYRKLVLLIGLFMIIREFSPFNVILINAKRIFQLDHEKDESVAVYMSITFAFVHVILEVARYWVNKVVDQQLSVVFGTLGVGLLSFAFGFLGLVLGSGSIISKIALMFWPVGYSSALSFLPFLLASLPVPLKAVSTLTAVNWFFGFLVVQFYPGISEGLGVPQTFVLFGLISIVSTVIFQRYLEPTKKDEKEGFTKLDKTNHEETDQLNLDPTYIEQDVAQEDVLNLN